MLGELHDRVQYNFGIRASLRGKFRALSLTSQYFFLIESWGWCIANFHPPVFKKPHKLGSLKKKRDLAAKNWLKEMALSKSIELKIPDWHFRYE